MGRFSWRGVERFARAERKQLGRRNLIFQNTPPYFSCANVRGCSKRETAFTDTVYRIKSQYDIGVVRALPRGPRRRLLIKIAHALEHKVGRAVPPAESRDHVDHAHLVRARGRVRVRVGSI